MFNKKISKAVLCTLIFIVFFTVNIFSEYGNTDFIILNAEPGDAEILTTHETTIDLNFSGEPVEIGEYSATSEKEIVLVLDVSGSMNSYMDGSKRIDILKDAAIAFIQKFNNPESNTKIGIITYSTDANHDGAQLLDVYTNYNTLYNKINGLSAGGGTNIGDGMRRGYYLLGSGTAEAKKYMLIMTDGIPTFRTVNFWYEESELMYDMNTVKIDDGNVPYISSHPYWSYISKLIAGPGSSDDSEGSCLNYGVTIGNIMKNNAVESFVIGFSGGTSEDRLETLANACGSNETEEGKHFYQADTENAINEIYESIADIIVSEIPIPDNELSVLLPEGISFSEDIQKLNGIYITDIMDDFAGTGRTKVIGEVPGLMLRRIAEGDYEGFYELDTQYAGFGIVGDTKGEKLFLISDMQISYNDPFEGSHTAYPEDDFIINIIQPVTGVDVPENLMIYKDGTDVIELSFREPEPSNTGVVWESENHGIATINEEGLITGIERGEVYIIGTSEGTGYGGETFSDTCLIMVIEPDIDISISGEVIIEIWTESSLSAELIYQDILEEGREYSWQSGDENILQIDENGLITANNIGQVTVTCTGSGIDLLGNPYEKSESITIQVVKSKADVN
jgi:uncharacterized protein YjdB